MDKLINMNIRVNETYLKNNNLPSGEFTFRPKITRNFFRVENKENAYEVMVNVEMYNTKEHPFPVDFKASVSGIFIIDGTETEDNIDKFLKIQGFQMVFPYLRSLVSNMLSNAMMPPIVMPIVFADQFVDEI